MARSPDGAPLATTDADGVLYLWDTLDWSAVAAVDTPHVSGVRSAAWSGDGAHLATADHSGLVMVRDRDGQEVTSLALQASSCLAWESPLLAVGRPGRPVVLELRDPADPS